MSSEDRATRIAAVEVAATDPLTRAEAWATLMTAMAAVTPARVQANLDRHMAELCTAMAAVADVPEGDFKGMTAAVAGMQAAIESWDEMELL